MVRLGGSGLYKRVDGTLSISFTSALSTCDRHDISDIFEPVFFPRGVKSTNLVFYGPVGSTFVSAKLDGQDFVPQAGANDLGRQAVLVNFESDPGTTHTVEVKFSAPADQKYGPLDVRTTPMIEKVPVNIDSPGCG